MSLFVFAWAENFQKLIIQTIITWAKSDLVADQNLIRAMFSLFHRQYDGVAEVRHCRFLFTTKTEPRERFLAVSKAKIQTIPENYYKFNGNRAWYFNLTDYLCWRIIEMRSLTATVTKVLCKQRYWSPPTYLAYSTLGSVSTGRGDHL